MFSTKKIITTSLAAALLLSSAAIASAETVLPTAANESIQQEFRSYCINLW